MKITDHPSWDILLDDEKKALTLAMGHGKSTWEAGEIMEKSHYKYLEIVQRAEYFLKLFKRHYDDWGMLIPPNCSIDSDFHDYLMLVMGKRKTVKEAAQIMDAEYYKKKGHRDEEIIESMEKIQRSSKAQDQAMFNLIHEFDRWNNFRILPLDIQMPSAFKRRNKTRLNKHMKRLNSLPEFTIEAIIDQLTYTGKLKIWYTVVLTPHDPEDSFKVIPVRRQTKFRKFATNCGLFLYENKEDAEYLGDLLIGYLNKENKSCIEGQVFWPKFRDMISKAINYPESENLVPNKKYLPMAPDDTRRMKTKKEKKLKSMGAKRISESL